MSEITPADRERLGYQQRFALAKRCGLGPYMNPLDALSEYPLVVIENLAQAWRPDTDQRHLALVLQACEREQLELVELHLLGTYEDWYKAWLVDGEKETYRTFQAWLLTVSPAVVCRAVLDALGEKGA